MKASYELSLQLMSGALCGWVGGLCGLGGCVLRAGRQHPRTPAPAHGFSDVRHHSA